MTNPEQWARVKDLFEAARELPGDARRAYLDETCRDDLEMRAELESLLSSYDSDSGDFLETPVLAAQAGVIADALPDAQLGNRIGPYLLTRRIGEGGMGVVYEGSRADGEFRQRVAIKLVKRGMDTDYILRRFRNERQILAGLTHPNIGKLLDGGATLDGSPYFVMEFIEGELIDRYCRARSLDVRARVELMVQVCSAVEHAHQHRIIHRDIKPGNILVDRNGIPKLLDFGIAKLLDHEAGVTAIETVTSLRMITPEYASPEQTRGEVATEQSDVYSLGVVLYELLAGHRPTAGGPVPPAETVPRDLLRVAGKAMHEDPQRRYRDVHELAVDLTNYLAGRPVAVRPDSVFYRASRTFQRNTRAAWAVSLVLVAAIVFALSWAVLKGPGLFSGRRLSVAVVGFQNVSGLPGAAWLSTALTEMLGAEVSSSGKIRAIPGDAVVRMRTDLALQLSGSYSAATLGRIRSNLQTDYVVGGTYLASGDQPDSLVRIDLRLQDAKTGDSLAVITDTGTYVELAAMATRAGARMREALGARGNAPSAAQKLNPEAQRLYAEGLNRLRQYDPLGAQALLERAVALDPADALSQSALSSTLAQLGYQERALAAAKQAIDLSARLPREKRLGVEARYYAMQRNWAKTADTYRTLWTEFPDDLNYGIGLANAQSNAGTPKAALETLARLHRDPAAAEDPRVHLADALAAEGIGDAKSELSHARLASAQARRNGSRLLLGESLYYEGWSNWLLGDLPASNQAYQEALAIFRDTGNKRRVVDITSGMSATLFDEGKVMESAQLLEGALPIARELGDPQMESTLINNLARCWQDVGQLSRARKDYETVVAIDRRIAEPQSLAVALNNLAGALKDAGDFDPARQFAEESLALARQTGRKSTIALALMSLADNIYTRGDLPGAWKLQAEALALALEIDRKSTIASLRRDQGNVLRSQGKFAEAAAAYEEAVQVVAAGKEDGRLAEIRSYQAGLARDQGNLEAAEKLARQALDGYRQQHSESGEALAAPVLASILSERGNPTEAAALVRTARRLMGAGEVLATRLAVEEAEARIAESSGRSAEALRLWQRLASDAHTTGVVEVAWDAELGIARVSPGAASKQRARKVVEEASARGFHRVAAAARAIGATGNTGR